MISRGPRSEALLELSLSHAKERCALAQKQRQERAKLRARTILGRRCKWCGRGDHEVYWSTYPDECKTCLAQRYRRAHHVCGGPFYIRPSKRRPHFKGVGCVYCSRMLVKEWRESLGIPETRPGW